MCPLPVPGVSSNAALPATPPYSTHYATLDYTNFHLSLSVLVYLHPIPFSRLSVPSCPSRLALSRFYPHLVPTCSIAPSPSRVYIAECMIVTPASVLHGRRLRRVLCSFRQFNATMSHERPVARPSRQSFRQIVVTRLFAISLHYSFAELGLIKIYE